MNKKAHQWLGIFKSIGPGLLFAGAAIGASHLVQSTRAGANYGYRLIGLIILVLALKYPFFEYAHRYTAATGKTILKGYLNLGRWALAIFFVLALCAAFINTAAVTLVTACLGGFLFGIDISPALLSIPVIIVVAVILLLGRYPLLDKAMKIMLSLLAIATLVAVSAALVKGNPALSGSVHPKLWNLAGVTFLLALMGWMPTPLDISVWPSLWRIERKKQTRYTPSMKEVLFDFNFGYILTGILAIAFLLLGALVMYGSGQTFSNSGIQFSEQLISLYTKTIGGWSWLFIAIATFFTMFSTTLTVFDGYTRTIRGSIKLLFPKTKKRIRHLYWIVFGSLVVFTICIIGFFVSGIKSMVDIATILAFLAAPPLAYLNFKVVTSGDMPEEHRPKLFMRLVSWLAITLMSLFSVIFIYWRFIK